MWLMWGLAQVKTQIGLGATVTEARNSSAYSLVISPGSMIFVWWHLHAPELGELPLCGLLHLRHLLRQHVAATGGQQQSCMLV